MRTKNQISLSRKSLYGIMLIAIFFSAFGNSNALPVRAQNIYDIGTPIHDVDPPLWWSGTCDDTNFSGHNGLGLHSTTLSSWHGVVACGPLPLKYKNNSSYHDYKLNFPGPADHEQWEFECVELVMRFLYLEWGIHPWSNSAYQLRDNPPSSIVFYPNDGTHRIIPGDILTEDPKFSGDPGHVAIITNTDWDLDSTGTGHINILEQNSSSTGSRPTNKLLKVTNWRIGDSKAGDSDLYDTFANGKKIQGWLHVVFNQFGDVTGYVYKSPSSSGQTHGQPLSGVTVSAASGGTSGITDQYGHYILSYVPIGDTNISTSLGGAASITVQAYMSQVAPDITVQLACTGNGSAQNGMAKVASLSNCPPGLTTDNATLISQTPSDGTIVSPNQSLTKTWRVKNSGTSTWAGYKLKFISGERMGGPSETTIPTTASGATVDISVNMTAPIEGGTHTGYWQLNNSQGGYFGPEIHIRIGVPGGGNTDPSIPTANGIQLLSVNYPSNVIPGQSFHPSVTIKLLNGELYGVNSRGDMLRNKSGGEFGAWPHVAVAHTVHTGEEYTFNFDQAMVAPATLGVYDSVWQIWAANGWVGPEVHIRFTVGFNSNRGPNVPLLTSPDNWYVSRDGSVPNLCAQDQGDLDGDPITHYQFQIYESGQNWDSGWITSNCVTPQGLGVLGYQWHARVEDNQGSISDWSQTWHFNIESGDVTVTEIHFDIPSPSNSEQVRVFASTSGCGGTNIGMRVLINSANDGSTNGEWGIIYELGVPILTTENAPYWDTRPYEDGTHLVRVLAKGCTDATWEDGSFKDVPYVLQHRKPSWPPPQTPINNAWLNSPTVLFRWAPALRAQQYHLWVSTNPNPEVSPIVNLTFNPDVLSYTYTFGQDYPEVYWKIRATNELGYNESVVYRFGIDRQSPDTAIQPLDPTTYQSSFVLRWSGNDVASGLRWFDVQEKESMETDWQDLRTNTTDTAMIFTGQPGHTYCFQTRGLDIAGNEEPYPSGNGDQCITIDLSSQPPQEWWNPDYQYKRDLVILNNDAETLAMNSPIQILFNQNTNPTASQIYTASVTANKGDDVRIIYNGFEIPRYIRSFNTNQVEIWFKASAALPGHGSDNTHYQMYYGNPTSASPGFGVNDVFSPPADTSTVGLWHFQDGQGSTIVDTSGHNRTGTVVGSPQWFQSPLGYYLNFNRNSPYYGDYVDVGSINLSTFTLEAWINLSNLDANGSIISKWGGSGNNSYNFAIWNRKIGIQLSGVGGNDELQSTNIQPSIGSWQHVAATYDGGSIKLYINGTLVAEKGYSRGVNSSSTSTAIGRSNDGSNGTWYFQGGISHVSISNVAKSSFPYTTLPVTTISSVQASEQITYEPPITGAADLVIGNIVTYPLSLVQGGGTQVEVTVTNQGTAPTRNGFYTDLYLNHLPTGVGDYANSVQFWINDPIDPGETVTLSSVITDLSSLGLSAAQSRLTTQSTSAFTEINATLYAQTDSAGLVTEPDNQNNIYSAGTQVCTASPDNFGNDGGFASASLIAAGGSQIHNFDIPGDEDWIKFIAQIGKKYNITTSSLGVSADTTLYLYGPDGQTLIASNDDFNNSLASQIEWTAPQNGTYYVLIKNWNPNTGGCGTGYTIGLSDISTPVTQTKTFTSAPTQDGWILESSEKSNKGGTLNAAAATLNLGDDKTRKQYRGILSFNTASLPNNAVITKVTLKVRKSAIVGPGNPLTIFQGFMVDIKNGFFGTSAALQASDFQAGASHAAYGPFTPSLVSNWYSINLTAGQTYINKAATNGGLTQIRLRFKIDDNNNAVANYLSLFSGNTPTTANRPQLVITYYVP